MSRKETERTKLIQEKCQTLLTQMLRDEDNKYCVDCDAKGPRWASWNLGVFLCIRCAGIHRNLGVHISRVKSVNLDTWTPEQVISLQQMGNSRARAVYEAQLPDGFRRPQTDTALESFIRAKYEHKKYLAREWVPPSPPKVDWAKEIDEELEKQKRKKKAAQAGSVLGIGVMSSGSGGGDKKSAANNSVKSVPLPAPLPKPKAGQCGSSPKTTRLSGGATGGDFNQPTSNDLLGLSSPTKPVVAAATTSQQDLHNDSFSGFLSAAPIAHIDLNQKLAEGGPPSLAQEEEDFFNQGSLGSLGASGGDKDKSGKLTKDSILALYGAAPTNNHNPHNPQMNFGQPQQQMFGAGGFTGMAPGYMGAPHPQQQQFMTPPNSASMYNAPVMTAPAAFTAAGFGGGGAGGGSQFPLQVGGATVTGFPQQQQQQMTHMSMSGIMATGQQQQTAANAANNQLNLMHTNQSLLSGMTMMGGLTTQQQQQQQQLQQQHQMGFGMMSSMPMAISGMHHPTSMNSAAFQAPSAAASNTNLMNQQFGNLNIGNVWQ